MRALVTGACGFVGAHLIRHLLESGDTVLGTIIGPRVETVPGCSYRELDVRNMQHCAEAIGEFRPEAIYHLAGISFVPEAENNFDNTLSINVAGVNNIFRVAHLMQLETTVLLISSAEVYGKVTPDDLPLNEDSPVRPINNYSLSKAFAEMVATRYGAIGKVHPVIARPFNHIGAGQNNRFVASSFAYQLALIAKGKNEAVIEVGNLDARRDFSDVRDISRGYRLAATKGNGIYNFCSGRAVSIQYILDSLVEISGLKVEVRSDPERMRPADVPSIYGDYSRANAELGWIPRYDLRDTLRDVYQYWFERV